MEVTRLHVGPMAYLAQFTVRTKEELKNMTIHLESLEQVPPSALKQIPSEIWKDRFRNRKTVTTSSYDGHTISGVPYYIMDDAQYLANHCGPTSYERALMRIKASRHSRTSDETNSLIHSTCSLIGRCEAYHFCPLCHFPLYSQCCQPRRYPSRPKRLKRRQSRNFCHSIRRSRVHPHSNRLPFQPCHECPSSPYNRKSS